MALRTRSMLSLKLMHDVGDYSQRGLNINIEHFKQNAEEAISQFLSGLRMARKPISHSSSENKLRRAPHLCWSYRRRARRARFIALRAILSVPGFVGMSTIFQNLYSSICR